MARPQSPLVGYNTNVRHRGKLYHIQTEDSGINHPHVITHLFADGGRIIASRKTSYAEHVGAEDLASIVRKLMQDQHKGIFIALRDCVFDEDAPDAAELGPAAGAGKESTPNGAPTAASSAGATTNSSRSDVVGHAPTTPPNPLSIPPAPPQATPHRPVTAVGGRAQSQANAAPHSPSARTSESRNLDSGTLRAASDHESGTLRAAGFTHDHASAPSARALDAVGQDRAGEDLDYLELDRAAAQRVAESATGRAPQSPPAPPLQRQGTPNPANQRTQPPLPPGQLGGIAARGSGRYRQTVPAQTAPEPPKPPSNNESIFGGQLLKGRSLDEVILSYLADDLGEGDH